ncbi:excisionase [Sphingomonas bisphenolicum]|uniref:Helix-turn-helix domain-containing protein n=1 Tax=Sphingomonas bisphenolicum TaxID=296544 RepID=A0ABM7FXM0_9SPHN|nr:excisionase [Sphingomonas bisphenolicum]BBF68417.1 hypothetical protein SBA_ch1_06170 [Sphingomonas bisphenolicum]
MELLLNNKDARSALGGIGNTSFFALINQGKLKRVKIGRRTFVTVESVREVAQGAADPAARKS